MLVFVFKMLTLRPGHWFILIWSFWTYLHQWLRTYVLELTLNPFPSTQWLLDLGLVTHLLCAVVVAAVNQEQWGFVVLASSLGLRAGYTAWADRLAPWVVAVNFPFLWLLQVCRDIFAPINWSVLRISPVIWFDWEILEAVFYLEVCNRAIVTLYFYLLI